MKRIGGYIIVLTVTLFMLTDRAYAQRYLSGSRQRVVQFSGIVVDGFETAPLPFVTIYNTTRRHGTTSDHNGYFSFVAVGGDSIRYSCIGFQTRVVVIPDTVSYDAYSMVVPMEQDTVMLLETVIYPWPSKEKFRDAFLNLELPKTDADIIQKNFDLATMREQARNGKMDANMNYRDLMAQQSQKLYYQNQMPSAGFLNPFAWARFIQQLKRKKKADKMEKLNEGYRQYESEYDDEDIYGPSGD